MVEEEDHLPCFAEVDDVNAIGTRFPQVRLHMDLEILGTDVALCCEQHLNVGGGGIEYWGKVCGRHGELCTGQS